MASDKYIVEVMTPLVEGLRSKKISNRITDFSSDSMMRSVFPVKGSTPSDLELRFAMNRWFRSYCAEQEVKSLVLRQSVPPAAVMTGSRTTEAELARWLNLCNNKFGYHSMLNLAKAYKLCCCLNSRLDGISGDEGLDVLNSLSLKQLLVWVARFPALEHTNSSGNRVQTDVWSANCRAILGAFGTQRSIIEPVLNEPVGSLRKEFRVTFGHEFRDSLSGVVRSVTFSKSKSLFKGEICNQCFVARSQSCEWCDKGKHCLCFCPDSTTGSVEDPTEQRFDILEDPILALLQFVVNSSRAPELHFGCGYDKSLQCTSCEAKTPTPLEVTTAWSRRKTDDKSDFFMLARDILKKALSFASEKREALRTDVCKAVISYCEDKDFLRIQDFSLDEKTRSDLLERYKDVLPSGELFDALIDFEVFEWFNPGADNEMGYNNLIRRLKKEGMYARLPVLTQGQPGLTIQHRMSSELSKGVKEKLASFSKLNSELCWFAPTEAWDFERSRPNPLSERALVEFLKWQDQRDRPSRVSNFFPKSTIAWAWLIHSYNETVKKEDQIKFPRNVSLTTYKRKVTKASASPKEVNPVETEAFKEILKELDILKGGSTSRDKEFDALVDRVEYLQRQLENSYTMSEAVVAIRKNCQEDDSQDFICVPTDTSSLDELITCKLDELTEEGTKIPDSVSFTIPVQVTMSASTMSYSVRAPRDLSKWKVTATAKPAQTKPESSSEDKPEKPTSSAPQKPPKPAKSDKLKAFQQKPQGSVKGNPKATQEKEKEEGAPTPKFVCTICGFEGTSVTALSAHKDSVSHGRKVLETTGTCPYSSSGKCPPGDLCRICHETQGYLACDAKDCKRRPVGPNNAGMDQDKCQVHNGRQSTKKGKEVVVGDDVPAKGDKPKDRLSKKNPLGGSAAGDPESKNPMLTDQQFKTLRSHLGVKERPIGEDWDVLDPASKRKLRKETKLPKWVMDAIRHDPKNYDRIRSDHLTKEKWDELKAPSTVYQKTEAVREWSSAKKTFKGIALLAEPTTPREKAYRKRYDSLVSKYASVEGVFPKLGLNPDSRDKPAKRGRSKSRPESSSRASSADSNAESFMKGASFIMDLMKQMKT